MGVKPEATLSGLTSGLTFTGGIEKWEEKKAGFQEHARNWEAFP